MLNASAAVDVDLAASNAACAPQGFLQVRQTQFSVPLKYHTRPKNDKILASFPSVYLVKANS